MGQENRGPTRRIFWAGVRSAAGRFNRASGALGSPIPSDCDAVVEAAEALVIREYDFFRLAFRRWSGREPEEKALERAFIAYMFHQRVPACVRHLSRDVLHLKASGTLDPGAFGIGGFTRRQPLLRLGRFS